MISENHRTVEMVEEYNKVNKVRVKKEAKDSNRVKTPVQKVHVKREPERSSRNNQD
jgi:hypothetical protein